MVLSHRSLFIKLQDAAVLLKSKRYAHWTLPQLMANTMGGVVVGKADAVVRDYQEMGALLTNHLSSKLARLLFPASHPFFKIKATPALIAKAKEHRLDESAFQAELSRLELSAAKQLFLNASYSQLIQALKHLIVTGNVLLYRDSAQKRTVCYGLPNFVVRRDGRGRMLDCVLKETTYVEALDEAVLAVLKTKDKARYSRPEQTVDLYTRIQRKQANGNWFYTVTQEVDTTPVGEPNNYPEHLCPWQVPTWSLICGEHYGRGLVEDYAGGFAKLSELSEAQTLYAIETMRVVHLVSSGSGTDIDDLANAENGEYIQGNKDTVTAHESGDSAKLSAVSAELGDIFGRLAKAFMYEANTRNAERVTAYELQRDANEAENALGGVYSALAEGFQAPLAHIVLVEVEADTLDSILSKDMRLDIEAGIPALGRSSDVQNLIAATQEAATVVPALTQLDKRISGSMVLDVILAGRSVDTKAIFKSKTEQEQEAQADKQMALGQAQATQAVAGADQVDQFAALQTPQG